MPFYKTKCKAGRTMEYGYYYSVRYNDGSYKKRAKKEKPTKESQKAVNKRKLEREATRIMNANFGPEDSYLTFTSKKENRPGTEEEFRKWIRNLLNGMRKIQKKDGKVLKYMWAAEVGKKGAHHIHMVVNDIDLKKVRDIWPHGFVHATPLDRSGQYRKLAEYLVKYSYQTEQAVGFVVGKKFNTSRNLKRPKPETKVITGRKKIPEKISIPKGWYLDRDSERRGIHEITGFPFLSYTLIKLE